MIYRVVYKVGYYEAFFEFDSIEVAGNFAKAMLVHGVESNDTKKKSMVRIEVINTEEKEQEEQ